MRIDVFTLFPELVELGADTGVIGRARSTGLLKITTHNPRDQATDVHATVDDAPFGGGAGMVMKPGPVVAAVEAAQPPRPLIYLGPSGRTFNQLVAEELSELPGFSLLCGRYEGVDQRVLDHVVDEELSLGDFVLAGGEAAALAVIEAVGRLVPGVLGNADSATDESFTSGLLEYPQYTRPADFGEWAVPAILRSGDHGRVRRWRLAQALRLTMERCPDLIEARGGITVDEQRVLDENAD